jgi:nuclear pore complex protein Nup98-Nup96
VAEANENQVQSEQMHVQQERTRVSDEDGVPLAAMMRTDFGAFATLIKVNESSDDLALQEKQIWELAHILFDDFVDDISMGVPDELEHEFDDRIRKDRLLRFWQDLVKDKVNEDLAKNLPHEEDAIIHLTAGNVRAACKSLLEAKDFHLATLVAQIGGDQAFREAVRGQVEEWRKNDMLSEMTDSVRALYEILSGNACKVDGVKGQLVNRASEFLISERFNLSWTQAFALRLWYVIYEDEPLENAVCIFDREVMSFADSAWPSPRQGSRIQDAEDHKAEWSISPLWTLLQIFAASKSPDVTRSIELPAAIMPKTLTGDIFNMRLTFQLYHALRARKGLKFRTSATLSDQLTIDFGSQIASSGQFVFAALVFLHLTIPVERERIIKELLARNAGLIPEVDEPQAEDVWRSLCGELSIPEKWMWEAKASHARSCRNYDEDAAEDEVRYLLEAEDWDEAHNTLCRTVAPKAIIEYDYEMLETLLAGFQDHPQHLVKDWQLGGGVYLDFVNLMLGRVEPTSADGHHGRAAVLRKLVKSLTEMARKGTMNFEESVAMKEMASVVADLVNEEADRINVRIVFLLE